MSPIAPSGSRYDAEDFVAAPADDERSDLVGLVVAEDLVGHSGGTAGKMAFQRGTGLRHHTRSRLCRTCQLRDRTRMSPS